MTHETLGERVARYRKRAGFRSAAELVARIGNPRVTESVIRNIESGRKADLSAAQLVDIAYAIGVPLVMLLAPMNDPAGTVDLPNVSERVTRQTPLQFDRWASGVDGAGIYDDHPRPADVLASLRHLSWLIRDRDTYSRWARGEDEQPGMTVEMAQEVHANLQARVEEIASALERNGVDVASMDRQQDD